MKRIVFALSVLVVLGAVTGQVSAQDTDEYFQAQCASCHTIGGGRLTGPDLKNMEERKDAAWLERFIADPGGVLASGDAYALKLKEEARGVVMPKAPGMTMDRAKKLVALIRAESALERSRFAGIDLDDRPFTPEDIIVGEELFTGNRRLKNGGPACISCHSIGEMGGLGGGLLGPNLTDCYARLEGRKALGAWLASPATLTMSPVYRTHPIDVQEILPLLAFLEESGKAGLPDQQGPGIEFLLIGVVGAVILLILLDVVWRRRLTGVRSRLFEGKAR